MQNYQAQKELFKMFCSLFLAAKTNAESTNQQQQKLFLW